MRKKEPIRKKPFDKWACLKHQWAGWMQKQSQKLSVRIQKFLLVLFCLLTTAYLSVVVFRSFDRPAIPDSGHITKPLLESPEDRPPSWLDSIPLYEKNQIKINPKNK